MDENKYKVTTPNNLGRTEIVNQNFFQKDKNIDKEVLKKAEKYLENINIEKLSSFYKRDRGRDYRVSFAINEKERVKMIADQKRRGFSSLSEYIRDTLIYNQKGSNEKLSSKFIIRLSELGGKISKYEGNDINKFKKLIIEEIIKIIKEIE